MMMMMMMVVVVKDDARMRLSSVVPDAGELLRGMSIASDTLDELVTADEYYLQPHNSYVDNRRRPSNPLRRVSIQSCIPQNT